MKKQRAPDETASRANDCKTPEKERRGNSGGKASDGKFEDVPQGGKRRGPGRWIAPQDDRPQDD